MNQQNQQQDVAIFNNPLFGDAEVLNLNGKFYFPATKVASILGYKRPEDAVSRHCIPDYPWSVKRGGWYRGEQFVHPYYYKKR